MRSDVLPIIRVVTVDHICDSDPNPVFYCYLNANMYTAVYQFLKTGISRALEVHLSDIFSTNSVFLFILMSINTDVQYQMQLA